MLKSRGAYTLGRRPALDGLRAIAVLAVVAAHANGWWMSSGQVGVTLFFVLSGFLITRLMLEEHQRSGRVDLRRFWTRRARRLLPAALLVLGAVGSLMLAAGQDMRPVFLGGLYVANLAKASGAHLGILEHLWSLSMEEQFYAVWPLAFVLLVKRPGAVMRWVLGAGVAAAAAWWLVVALSSDSAARVMFGPDTRVIDMLLGCLLACVIGYLPRRAFAPAAVAFAFVAVAIPGPVYGPLTMLPVALAATGLVGWAATAEGGIALAIVTASPLRWLGGISYGVYLWNYPVAQLMVGRAPLWATLLITLAVPVALAWASWRFVEAPLMATRAKPVSGRTAAAQTAVSNLSTVHA